MLARLFIIHQYCQQMFQVLFDMYYIYHLVDILTFFAGIFRAIFTFLTR